jgi:hypothetical protein
MKDAPTLGEILMEAERLGFNLGERHDIISKWREAIKEFQTNQPEKPVKTNDLFARFAYHDLAREYASTTCRKYMQNKIDEWQR